MAISLAVRIGGLVLGAASPARGSGCPDRRPSRRRPRPLGAPASEKAKKNPLPSDKKTIDQGEKVAKITAPPAMAPRERATAPPRPRSTQARGLDVQPRQDESDARSSGRSPPGEAPCRRGGTCPRTTLAVVRYIARSPRSDPKVER